MELIIHLAVENKHKLPTNTCKGLLPLRSCAMKKDASLSCCIEDECRPLGFGNQILESNCPMRHPSRVFVVSDREKAEINLSGMF